MSDGTLSMLEILRSGGFTVADLIDAFREFDEAAVVEGDDMWVIVVDKSAVSDGGEDRP